ncbi:hypothetical protein THAR02_01653 [Trichoderma harzianum]|uniref:Uncharacterized protein n=1 Tax=Trichoderma harzianum TaxID=5544 RepID=A0A0G0A1N6_TRIHA|nr:hypothetical protein THAR02_01653 [Trichoderma harzianum]
MGVVLGTHGYGRHIVNVPCPSLWSSILRAPGSESASPFDRMVQCVERCDRTANDRHLDRVHTNLSIDPSIQGQSGSLRLLILLEALTALLTSARRKRLEPTVASHPLGPEIAAASLSPAAGPPAFAPQIARGRLEKVPWTRNPLASLHRTRQRPGQNHYPHRGDQGKRDPKPNLARLLSRDDVRISYMSV